MLLLCSIITFVLTIVVIGELYLGGRKFRSLDAFEGITEKTDLPLVSLVVPARNEEAGISSALESLCSQDYGNIEIIIVNDRSTDRTGEKVERFRRTYPFVKLIDIETLPEGWLGKAHALQRGADEARGAFLVFSDADVRMEPTTISRAVAAMMEEGLDHLALTFRNISQGLLLNALIIEAGIGLVYLLKPWRAKDPNSRFFLGVGAFNMVRASAYRAAGGHFAIRMQAIDDLFLGKLMKYAGNRQECLRGERFISLPWYDSVADMVAGLMKNTFALFHYRLHYAVAAVVSLLFMFGIPAYGILFGSGVAQLLFLLAICLRGAVVGTVIVKNGHSVFSVFMLVVTPFISVFIILKSAVQATVSGKIVWRDSSYSLHQLRSEPWVLDGIFSFSKRSGAGKAH